VTTGLDLKLHRVAANIKGYELAEAMGVSASRVSAIEGSRIVQPDTATRYLTALDTLRNVPASQVAS
jgi:transcriptional regulator with XRE-family HTH domain